MRSLSFSYSGKFLASGGYGSGDFSVAVSSVCAGPSSNDLVVASRIDASTVGDEAHQDRVLAVQMHPTLPLVASSSADRTVRLWELDGLH